MFERILVPLDGSALAEEALQPALALARTIDGEVILLHSILPVYTAMPVVASEYDWIWPEYAREDSRREVRKYLEGVKKRSECPGCHISTVVMEGDAASAIVDTAEEEEIDLIVVSTYGESGVGRAIFGSTTERVLHSATCPVLVTRSARPISSVLVTLDGSRLAERALRPALELATRLGATVHLLRVNEPPEAAARDLLPWGVEEPAVPADMAQRVRDAGQAYLQDVMLRYDLSPAQVQTTVAEGKPVERIMEFADLHGIDVIAMSTHGHTGLRRWLYGSVTLKVMRGSGNSMLIVRPPAEELAE